MRVQFAKITYRSSPSHIDKGFRPSPLSDGDIKLKVVSLLNLVMGRNVSAINVENRLLSTLRLARSSTVRRVAVVLGQSLDAGDIVTQASYSVNPGLVVVYTHGDEEALLVLLSLEAEHARGTTAAHGECQDAVLLIPLATVCVVPATLFNDVEIGVGVGLVDTDFDGVGHSECVSGRFGKRKRKETDLKVVGLGYEPESFCLKLLRCSELRMKKDGFGWGEVAFLYLS